MNNQQPFSNDYPIEKSTETTAQLPEAKKDETVELEVFDQAKYEVSKPKRVIIKAKIIL